MMFQSRSTRALRTPSLLLAIGAGLLAASAASAQPLIVACAAPAPGQNFFYTIDPATGVATQQAPTPGNAIFSALAASADGRYFAWQNGALWEINTTTWEATQLTTANGPSATCFDIIGSTGYVIPNAGDVRLYEVNLADGLTAPIGAEGQLASDLLDFYGTPVAPFIIGLGSVQGQLYGVHTSSARTNLLRIDPATGEATPLGTPNNVPASAGGGWTGFASMTGVDTDSDGVYDTLIGGVNFRNSARVGGVVRYNLSDGTFDLLNTNSTLIFFGMASAPAQAPSCSYDFNRDENVDLLDAQQMAQVFVGILTPESNWLDGDLNGDENADLTDAQLLAAFVVSGECGI